MTAVFDTNILIDFLAGREEARKELLRYSEIHVSIITWIEVLVGVKTEDEQRIFRAFLSGFVIEPLTSAVAEKAVEIRKTRKIRMPDAIIWATALERGTLLVTRNTKDFPKGHPSIRSPYR